MADRHFRTQFEFVARRVGIETQTRPLRGWIRHPHKGQTVCIRSAGTAIGIGHGKRITAGLTSSEAAVGSVSV